MREGKLDFEDLRNIILNNKTIKRNEVKVRNDVGEDYCIIDFRVQKILSNRSDGTW